MSDAELALRMSSAPESVGAISLGRPNRGALVNSVPLPETALWHVVTPAHAFGTEETIASLMRAIERVEGEFPGQPKLSVGDISAERGGTLRPHRSHQSGRDADVGYYYLGHVGWYQRANAENLDRPRTWALVKALADDDNVEAIFMDRSVQRLLRDHAERTGEGRAVLSRVFERQPRGIEPIVRHEWGHLTHFHVRFKCPVAQASGVRANRVLAALGRTRS